MIRIAASGPALGLGLSPLRGHCTGILILQLLHELAELAELDWLSKADPDPADPMPANGCQLKAMPADLDRDKLPDMHTEDVIDADAAK